MRTFILESPGKVFQSTAVKVCPPHGDGQGQQRGGGHEGLERHHGQGGLAQKMEAHQKVNYSIRPFDSKF